MKMISWNVNGLRACREKGFVESMLALNADVICVQETKMQKGQADISLPGYELYMNSALKKGYSGTAVFTRVAPLRVTMDIGIPEHDQEGRVIRADFDAFTLVNCYTPNSQDGLRRLEYRMRWEDDFRQYLTELDKAKPVIVCGDLNVAHEEIDLKNPRSNRMNAGFTDQERGKFTALLQSGFCDSFRSFHPDAAGEYSWWSYIGNARSRNAGWRIDYFVVSDKIAGRMTDASIHQEIFGSDHCPVELTLDA